jgi:uncharacterized protein
MRIRSAVLGVVAMGVTRAFAQDYPTPSFDCANIMTPQELQICRSPELAELDGHHGSLVERAIRASADREQTRADMDAWLERVRNPCQTHQCLMDAYTAHIRELELIVPPLETPQFAVPTRRDVASVVAKADSEPVKPAAAKAAPPPGPVTVEDDDDDDDGRPAYVIAIGLASLALLVWGAFRLSRRTHVNADGERDASDDRP